MNSRRPSTVVTFYSYKGGVGRTQALADVAILLARRGRRVLMVDFDLEAPGLDVYFRAHLVSSDVAGLVELITDFKRLGPEQAARQHTDLAGVPGVAPGRLALVRAGRGEGDHAGRVQALRWHELYAEGFGYWLEDVRSHWQRSWDYVLVDSRTGTSDSGGICTMHLPQVLVVFSTLNTQGLTGTMLAARQAVEGQARLPVDRAGLRVVPVATRLDTSEHAERREWLAHWRAACQGLVDVWSDAPERTPQLLDALATPYVPFWSYGERLPVVEGDVTDRFSVEYAHETLALLLDSDLGEVARLLDDRNELVAGPGDATEYDIGVYFSGGGATAMLIQLLGVRGLRAVSLTADPGQPGSLPEALLRARACRHFLFSGAGWELPELLSSIRADGRHGGVVFTLGGGPAKQDLPGLHVQALDGPSSSFSAVADEIVARVQAAARP